MIKQSILKNQIQAMKDRDQQTLDTLRYILSQIKNVEIEKRAELVDKEVVDILRKETKKLSDSIVSFAQAGRTDLVAEYEAQKAIIKEYLPQEMSDTDLKAEIDKIITKNQKIYDANPNALIGICIKELGQMADPSRISSLVRSKS